MTLQLEMTYIYRLDTAKSKHTSAYIRASDEEGDSTKDGYN